MKEEKEKVAAPQTKRAETDEIFTLVQTKEGVRITIGNFVITRRTFRDFEQAEKYLQKKPYEILINVASLIAAQTIENNEIIKKNAKKAEKSAKSSK